jgi:hypothetical protein
MRLFDLILKLSSMAISVLQSGLEIVQCLDNSLCFRFFVGGCEIPVKINQHNKISCLTVRKTFSIASS